MILWSFKLMPGAVVTMVMSKSLKTVMYKVNVFLNFNSNIFEDTQNLKSNSFKI